MTQQAPRAYEIADRFRAKGIKVVLGGIHVTVLPHEARCHADSVIVGEAENTWEELLVDFASNRLRPVYTSRPETDLEKSPVPRYELLHDKPYKIVWIQTSRGCPHDCGFCCASRVYGYKYRQKTISQAVEEIKKVRRIKKHALIGFADDNLFANRKYSRELLEKIVGLGVKWIGQSDISIAYDESMLKLIKQSGCVVLLIGLESLDENNLKGLDSSNWKQKQLKNYEGSIRAIQNHGIGVIGNFIVGFDNDDHSTFDRIARFVIDNCLAGAQIAALTPFPNTRLREELLRAGRVFDTSWENYTLYDVNIKPEKMSCQELEKGVLDLFKKVYSPGVAARKKKYFKDIFSTMRRNLKPRLSQDSEKSQL
jgi:radical SAM superfamily enzyme YgiQ (UPF0313 family)